VIHVIIADDQALVRHGFRLILREEPGIEVVGEAASGREAVDAATRLRPDVILMDVRMPILDGIAATREIVAGGAPSRVLILTTFDLDEHVYDALEAGASGFLLKDLELARLADAVRVVAQGEALLAPTVTRRLIGDFVRRRPSPEPSFKLGDLTEREAEVLRLLARGLSNQEIAARLSLGDTTIKTHVAHVLGKLGLRDRVQAVILAYETGLVRPSSS
jgi:DNA-binding NarL/FixJ family response regulator